LLIHSNCYSLATGFNFPASASPLAAARMRSQSAIGRAGLVRTTAACRLPARQPLEPRPLFEYYLGQSRRFYVITQAPTSENDTFAICEVKEELGPEGHRSFHHDQVLKLIGSYHLRTDNASNVGRSGPVRILSFVGCPWDSSAMPGVRMCPVCRGSKQKVSLPSAKRVVAWK
jgi:hypothetical protein